MRLIGHTIGFFFASTLPLCDPKALASASIPPPATAREDLGPAATFLVLGAVVAVLLLGHFLREDRYRRPAGPDRGLGFVAAGREARARLSALAPKVMLVAEGEKILSRCLADESLEEETRRQAEAFLADAVPPGLWEKFVAASSLAEGDPERAHKELDELAPAVQLALDKLRRVEELLRPPKDGGGERAENYSEEG